MARILVTGGAGYIGSTTCKALYAEGHEVTVYDNLSTGHEEFLIFGDFVRGDIRETHKLEHELRSRGIEGVIHFAAKAYVGESMVNPSIYYENNVLGSLSLLQAMRAAGIRLLVFSSSCAVYGQPEQVPIKEDTMLKPMNPYGASKAMVERMCADFGEAYGLNTGILRYFNACGTEHDLLVGERHDPEPHIIPRLLMAASGEIDCFEVFGNDYETEDGTCVRDYVHVSDLADAHVLAFNRLYSGGSSFTCNLGTGIGFSINQLISSAATTVGRGIPISYKKRRGGDPACLVSDPSNAAKLIGWTPKYSDIYTIMVSAWAWQNRGMHKSRPSESLLPLGASATP